MGVKSGSGDGLLNRLIYWFTGGSANGLAAPGVVIFGSSGEPVNFNAAGGVTPTAVISGQIKIAVTGTAVPLPANVPGDSITVVAKETNVAKGFVGGTGVTRTDDGTGNSVGLLPTDSVTIVIDDSSKIAVNGSANDIFYYFGS